MKKITTLLLALVAIATQATSAHLTETLLLSAKMDGAQEVPAVTTNAKGIASLVLNATRDTIFVNISANGLSGAIGGIHIHTGAAGTNGGVVIDLTPYIMGNKITATLTGAAVTANMKKFLTEGLYINLHTAANPNGEIRGQIKLETDWNFSVDLNTANEVPAIMGNAYGLGSLNLTLDKGVLRFNIVCQDLTGTIGGAHLHTGAAGTNGAVIEDLTSFINGNVISGTIMPMASTVADILAGNVYINIHTAANPNGEIRGQLRSRKGLTFDANITGAQQVPAITTTARGVHTAYANAALDTIWFDVVVNGLSGAVVAAHYHNGAVGTNGGVAYDLTPNIMGNRIKGTITGTVLSTTFINNILEGDVYLNVHTAANPNGEIRGQVFRLAREGYTINLTGAQQIPTPVSTVAYGSGIVSVSREQDNAHYMWVAGDLSAPAAAAHFHKGLTGANGGVIYDLTPAMVTNGNGVSAFGYWKSTDATPFVLANSIQFRKDSVYLNIHTPNNPNGEIRGQVRRGAVSYDNVSTNDFGKNIRFDAYPNPATDQLNIDIDFEKTSNYTLVMNDVLGHNIFVKQYNNTDIIAENLNLQKLNAGVYTLSIVNNKNKITRKVIKY
jgi:hypothetical protein